MLTHIQTKNRYATSHARPTYCNVCRDALSGVTSHGLSCEVCKCKVHKRCAAKAIPNCKWTTLATVGKDIIEDDDGVCQFGLWSTYDCILIANLFVRTSLCHISGWKEIYQYHRHVSFVRKHVARCYVYKIGDACGVRNFKFFLFNFKYA